MQALGMDEVRIFRCGQEWMPTAGDTVRVACSTMENALGNHIGAMLQANLALRAT